MSLLRHAIRLMVKNPAYTAIAAFTLALGIGPNAAVFSVADALLFRPLDVPEIDRVYMLQGFEKGATAPDNLTDGEFQEYRRGARLIEHLSASTWWGANITGTGDPERVQGFRVSGDFFEALRLRPLLGRTLLPDEDEPGKDGVVVLSHDLWVRRFGADPRIVSARLELDGRSHQIVGVMPKGFRFPQAAEIWAPLAATAEERNSFASWRLSVFGRLKPGVSAGQAQEEIRAIGQRVAESHPRTHQGRTVQLQLLRRHVSGNYTADYTTMLFAATGFVLLIACVNIATLQFARASLRSREMGIRAALGASRLRLTGQMLVESGLLGVAGAMAGSVLALWWLDWMRAFLPAEVERYLPGWYKVGLNQEVVAFAAVVSVSSAMIAALAPSLRLSRTCVQSSLREGGRGGTSGARRHRLINTLVVLEMVLALVLLVGAGLMVKSFRTLAEPYPADVAASTLTLRLSLPEFRYPDANSATAFTSRMLDALGAIPEVRGAAMMFNLPYSGSSSSSRITVQGATPQNPGENPWVTRQVISPGLFATLGIPLVSGREFAGSDGKDSPPVAIVNEAFVRRYFPGQDPVGRRIRRGEGADAGPWHTIVGVVRDVRQLEIDRTVGPAFFYPYTQSLARRYHVVLRTSGDPMRAAAAARAAVLAIDRDLPVFEVRSLKKMVSDTLKGFEYVAVCMTVFAIIALLLAAVGIYGVMSSAVGERTREIGLRMALGASQGEVLAMVLRRGLVLTTAGLAIGLVCAYFLARALSGLIFGVSAADLTAYSFVLAALGTTAMVACYIPARRALRVDPIAALRNDSP